MIDEDIRALIALETKRQTDGLEMIPSENHTSPEVLHALGSRLTDKYSEGYPGMRYYGGCEFVDKVENLARDRAKALFGVDHANVQPYSGSPANMAVYFAITTEPTTATSSRTEAISNGSRYSPNNASAICSVLPRPAGVAATTGAAKWNELLPRRMNQATCAPTAPTATRATIHCLLNCRCLAA